MLPAARPAGEGVYALLRTNGKMHLAWALELPEQPGEVQKAFNIPAQASLAISIKNPEKGGPRSAQLSEEQKADYPQRLQKEFRDRRFATEDPRLLDYEGAEIILIGARKNPSQAYQVDLQPEDESEASADMFRQLRFAQSRSRAIRVSRCSRESGASDRWPGRRASAWWMPCSSGTARPMPPRSASTSARARHRCCSAGSAPRSC